MRPTLPLLLSFNGGYVDVGGFLALQGLFTSHVTGNLATLGASLVFGISGTLAKLLALPVFCIVVLASRLAGNRLRGLGLPVLGIMLALQLVLLIAGALLAIGLGPFADGDSPAAIVTGMTLVAAMAIQNAVHRVHFTGMPPSTVMTSTTTQLMIDIADLLAGAAAETRLTIRSRVQRASAAVAVFVTGCAAAALGLALVNVWCFIVPPAIALVALLLHLFVPDDETI
jgi:uncharacterized membrane protein YoaK (UPF0700 family)